MPELGGPTSQAAPNSASARTIGGAVGKVSARIRHAIAPSDSRPGIIQLDRPAAAAREVWSVAATVARAPKAAAPRIASTAVVRRGAIGCASRVAALRPEAPAEARRDATARLARQGVGSAAALRLGRGARAARPVGG